MQAICADFMSTLMPCLNRRACSANMVSGREMQMQICSVWKILVQINMYFAIGDTNMFGLEIVNAIKYVFHNWRCKYGRFGNC